MVRERQERLMFDGDAISPPVVIPGDCLDVLPTLPDASVDDLIITSPPYADARRHTYGGVKPDDYVDWFLPRAQEFQRVLAPTGSFVLNIKERCVNGERHTYVLDLIQALRSDCGFLWIEEYCWHKSTATPGRWRYRFRDAWERLLHFTVAKDFKMRQDRMRRPVRESTRKRGQSLGANDRTRQESATASGFGRNIEATNAIEEALPTNVLHGSPVTKNTGHSAAYPEWLPEFFINLFTDEDDLVLDPFVGSGTTLRVAQRLKRRSVGIEIDQSSIALVSEEFEIAKAESGGI